MRVLAVLMLMSCGTPTEPEVEASEPLTVTFATYNVSMYRDGPSELTQDLADASLVQGRYAAAVLQSVRPDVLLLNEVDYDSEGAAIAAFQTGFLEVAQDGLEPLSYPHVYIPETNTGEHSGFDLDNDGTVSATIGSRAYGGDAWGYGEYPGKYGLAVLSTYPLDAQAIRTFRELRWTDMPDNRLPTDWYDSDEAAAMRLSSKTHADVPVSIGNHTVHFLVSHPTPPTFDGSEDRNGRRNHDEIRFWAEYLDNGWMTDDAGASGGLGSSASFVIAGDLNADPNDGDSTDSPMAHLLEHPRVRAIEPHSAGASEASELQGAANTSHVGPAAADTTDFDDSSVGNLRIDYVLPSQSLEVRESGVFWPKMDEAGYEWVGRFPFPVSDHRLVFVTVDVPQE